jgi:NDP-sugar pyrophosphorylase family protein
MNTLSGVTGYVNAGGRGTRLNTVFAPDAKIGVTKALLEVGDPSLRLIDHQVNKLLAAGVDNVVVAAGDHEIVVNYLNEAYGDAPVTGVWSPLQLGNGGDLLRTVQEYPHLFSPTITIANVDTILEWSEASAVVAHRTSGADLTILLTLNKGVPNEDAFYVSDDNRVLYSAESTRNPRSVEVAKTTASFRGSSTGSMVIGTAFLKEIEWRPDDGALSLYKDVVAAALMKGKLFAYSNGGNFFIDVGTVITWTRIQEKPELLAPYLVYRV